MSQDDAAPQLGKRWYDHDPLLIEVLDLLRTFPDDVRAHAQAFLEKIEAQVGAEALEEFYALSKPPRQGNRWYDQDPIVSKAVELLRVAPQDAQRRAALRFLDAMKRQGLEAVASGSPSSS
ncbi:MAG: hypothetical protein IPK79_08920 [Vampirovibrionales bacterium]|nr:hypothetical protein [Vampirovibrionales bacterium]